MSQAEILQNITAEENLTICPECGGKMENKGGEVYCLKCGFIVE